MKLMGEVKAMLSRLLLALLTLTEIEPMNQCRLADEAANRVWRVSA